jgi:AhpD family alkylhydroperoxidase
VVDPKGRVFQPRGCAAHEEETGQMSGQMYQRTTAAQADRRKELAPEIHEAFENFSKAVFADGALDETTKQLIAVAVAHVTQCPYCIDGHTKLALRKGASDEQVMEAVWVAAEMRAGGAYAHSTLALSAMEHVHSAAAGAGRTT